MSALSWFHLRRGHAKHDSISDKWSMLCGPSPSYHYIYLPLCLHLPMDFQLCPCVFWQWVSSRLVSAVRYDHCRLRIFVGMNPPRSPLSPPAIILFVSYSLSIIFPPRFRLHSTPKILFDVLFHMLSLVIYIRLFPIYRWASLERSWQ